MAKIQAPNQAGQRICNALGIDANMVHSISVDFTAGKVGTAEIGIYLTDEMAIGVGVKVVKESRPRLLQPFRMPRL